MSGHGSAGPDGGRPLGRRRRNPLGSFKRSMLYTLDETVERVSGWILPDNPSMEPSIVAVFDGGRRRVRVPAIRHRADVAATGWHASGDCGFQIDAESCPGFDPARDFEIYDGETNVLLLRRGPAEPASLRLFHLETQTQPVYPLTEHVSPLMQMLYASAEMIGEQTLVNVMGLTFPSILVTGSVLYKSFEAAITRNGFKRSVLLSDSFRDLAGRLIRAQALAAEDEALTSWRGLGQIGLIQAVAGVDLGDPLALGRGLKRLSDDQFFALSSPTVRKLTAKVPDEPLQNHHVGQALDSLAEFDLVGFDDHLDAFLEGLEALLGRTGLPRADTASPEIDRVAAALRACRPARELVLLDEHLGYLARGAFEKVQAAATA